MEEIIIEKLDNNILVCILENSEIVEKYIFNVENSSTIGNIYIGTVRDIFEGMQTAFVDIGLNKNGFLSLKDAMPKVDMKKREDSDKKEIKISNVIKKGQKLIVQIRKEAFEDKGPRVSTHVTLAGNYLVLMPETDIVTISQKISNQSEKERLLEIVKANLPQNYGCIIRTDAEGIEQSEISRDLNRILKEWEKIQNIYKNNISEISQENFISKLLHDDNNIAMKIVRDMVRKTTKKIYVNDGELYENLLECLNINKFNEELICYEKGVNFIENFGLVSELDKINDRKIWLKSGAHIVIDKTEALTAIDVNSSKCIGKEGVEQTIFKVNKEAAIEIMKQIRLKDIGGIIIIDFIDMHNQEYKDEILRIMREEQKKDRSKIEVKDFTQLNLVEMTRKRMHV